MPYQFNRSPGSYLVEVALHYRAYPRLSLHQSAGIYTVLGSVKREINGLEIAEDFKITALMVGFGASYHLTPWLEPGISGGIMPTISYRYANDDFYSDFLYSVRPYIQFNRYHDKPFNLGISLGATYLQSLLPYAASYGFKGWGADLKFIYKYNF